MLKWFADRLAETGKDVRKDERGFTLIELLVVVIIVGILAAIAIPTFLGQQDNAREASVESDTRNAATAAQSYGTENDGDYSSIGTGDVNGELSEGNSIDTVESRNSGDDFCVAVTHDDGGLDNDTYSYATDRGSNDRLDSSGC